MRRRAGGFAGYYEIPAEHKTAEFGRWVTGPGKDLFRTIDKHLGDGLITPGTGLPFIAEDLGLVTPDVIELLEAFSLPGMKVLQFGFSDPITHFFLTTMCPIVLRIQVLMTMIRRAAGSKTLSLTNVNSPNATCGWTAVILRGI